MYDLYNQLLLYVNKSEEPLLDIVGYYESFEEDNCTDMLIAIAMVFEKLLIYVVAQDDDSFKLYSQKDWNPDIEFQKISLITNIPWLLAKEKPLLWSWMLYNQQGYFDGLQLEFAKDSQDESVVIQLIAIGSEIKFREVSSKVHTIKLN